MIYPGFYEKQKKSIISRDFPYSSLAVAVEKGLTQAGAGPIRAAYCYIAVYAVGSRPPGSESAIDFL